MLRYYRDLLWIQAHFYILNNINIISKIKAYGVKSGHIALIILAVLVIPNAIQAYNMVQTAPKPSDDWYDSLIWLRENTPDPGKPPQYGIMTWWNYGNWILYISKRPVVANNFQIGGMRLHGFS